MDLFAGYRIKVFGEHRAVDGETDAQPQSGLARTGAPCRATDFPSLEIWRPANAFNSGARHLFEPHGLPDTRRARIPDGVWLRRPVLLAARFFEVAGIVFDAHNQLAALVSANRGRDVERERGITALMNAD